MLRQPIIAVLGHVDHGKTTLLDAIRKTVIATKEAGGITQAIGSTEIPAQTIKDLSGELLKKFKFEMTIPGLLLIDTPGHEAFTTLRKRGGSIADLSILVIDINEGIMPQSDESIEILRSTRTPFVVAVTKIDRIQGWRPESTSFLKNYEEQSDDVKGEFEKKFYGLVEQFSSRGFSVERFDRVNDFTKTVAAVPISAKTGEGVPGLLAILVALSQQFLKDRLLRTDQSAGMVLEVKDTTGLGKTLDVIIYDGIVHKNDFLVISGKLSRITRIRALLQPEPLRDIRTEKRFTNVDECGAACGIKIAAPGIDDVISGSQIRSAKTKQEAEKLLEELEHEREEAEIHTEHEGLVLKADRIGSLEALISVFKDHPIRDASIGNITKQDVINAEANSDPLLRVVIGFNSQISGDADSLARDKKINIIISDVVYKLKEGYKEWLEAAKGDIQRKAIEGVTRPGKLKILTGFVFRASNPAIVGCEVTGGLLRSDVALFKETKDEIKTVGAIKQIQSQGENVSEAKTGEKIAVSISGPTVGRQILENDVLYTDVKSEDYKKLRQNELLISKSEKEVLGEIFEIKRKHDPRYGF